MIQLNHWSIEVITDLLKLSLIYWSDHWSVEDEPDELDIPKWFQGLVLPEIIILSSFTHPHVIPNLKEFHSSLKH